MDIFILFSWYIHNSSYFESIFPLLRHQAPALGIYSAYFQGIFTVKSLYFQGIFTLFSGHIPLLRHQAPALGVDGRGLRRVAVH